MSTNTADETLKKKTDQLLPEIKVERLPGTKVDMFKIKGKNGKEHEARQETFTEKEIPNTHLTQIAPMFYYCTDNNKILMIPFSIQFSVTEFLKLAASMARNLEKLLKTDEAPAGEEPAAK